MRIYRIGKIIANVAVLVLLAVPAWSLEEEGQEIMDEKTTVEWVCATYPERVKELFERIDLERDGLQDVKSAVAQGDSVGACKALLAYYCQSDSGKWLRRPDVQPGEARDIQADAILHDTFTFYEQTDRVPRKPNGGLDWAHDGPSRDIQWAMALNRHQHMNLLLNAVKSTGNRDYVRLLDSQIRDWAASVDFPGMKNYNPPWGTGLDVSFRAKNWSAVFFGLQNEPEFTLAARLLLLTRLPEHAHYLRHWHASGNWITMELSGLAIVAAAFPEFRESKGWIDYATQRLTKELTAQVYPDGVQHELTSNYHMVALGNFEQLAEICRNAGIPLSEEYGVGLEKMWNYIAGALRPDGNNPLNNDSDLGNYRDLVLHASETYSRPDWAYIASNGAQGTKPDYGPSLLFPWAGQLVLRSGWDADALWSFFDLGPWGTGHQHNDKLHVSVSAYGRDLLVDSGRFTYTGRDVRFRDGYALLSRAHNVIIVDGKGQSPGPGHAQKPIAEDDYLITPEMTFARGACDHFDSLDGKAVHTRAVVYLQSKLIVVADRIDTDRPRKLEALWHWHPRCTVTMDGQTILSNDAGAGNLRIVPVAAVDWETALVKGQEKPYIQGWYSSKYNDWEPNTTALFTGDIGESTAFVWLLLPARGTVDMIRGEILENTAEAICIRVHMSGEEVLTVSIPWRKSKPLVMLD